MVLSLPAAVARRFLVRRQLLDPPRRLAPEPESVLAVVERLGSLQFDPLEAPGARNHELVLHARIAGYRRGWCDALLYAPRGERRLFEAYNKSLNILPADDLPYHRFAWARAKARYESTILAERAATVRSLLGRLRAEGPLFTAALSEGLGGPVDWHWAPTAEGRAVLEALFETGRVGIARRDGNRRSYDLVERLFPAELLRRRVSRAAQLRHRLLSRYRAVGLLGATPSPEISGGAGTAAERAHHRARLVAEGALIPVKVEGLRGERYLLAGELPLLDAARAAETPRAVTLLAPLDPLMWDRKLVRDLFGFDYTWEVYTPVHRRRHGYYVLPILFGDRLVGRIEPRVDREAEALRVHGIWFEAGFDPLAEPGFAAALGEALASFRDFVGVRRVMWARGRVATALARLVAGG